MNVLLLPYRLFEDLYVFRWPLKWKKMFGRIFSSFVWANLLCISSFCFLLLCHREYAARLLYVIECPFCLGRLRTASSHLWTESTSSYCNKDVLFPVFIVCMRSQHVKKPLHGTEKNSPDVKHGESDLTRSKPASIVCVPAPYLLPVLHVARHIGSRAELLTVNNNVKMLSLVPYRFFFSCFIMSITWCFFCFFLRLWLRDTLSYTTAQLLKTAKLNVLEFPCVVLYLALDVTPVTLGPKCDW